MNLNADKMEKCTEHGVKLQVREKDGKEEFVCPHQGCRWVRYLNGGEDAS